MGYFKNVEELNERNKKEDIDIVWNPSSQRWEGSNKEIQEILVVGEHNLELPMECGNIWIDASDFLPENVYVLEQIPSNIPIIINGIFKSTVSLEFMQQIFKKRNTFYFIDEDMKGAIALPGETGTIDFRLATDIPDMITNGSIVKRKIVDEQILENKMFEEEIPKRIYSFAPVDRAPFTKLFLEGITVDNFDLQLIMKIISSNVTEHIDIPIKVLDCNKFSTKLLLSLEHLKKMPITFIINEIDNNEDNRISLESLYYCLTDAGINANELLKLDGESIEEYLNKSRFLDIILGFVPKDASQLDIVTYISIFLIRHISYDWENYIKEKEGTGEIPRRSHLEVLEGGIGVCRDYASLMCWLLKKFNIDCQYVGSKHRDPKQDSHAFNIVTIDSIPYYVDITWEKNGEQYTQLYKSSYYLVSTELFLKTHYDYVEVEKYDCPRIYPKEEILQSIIRTALWNENYCITDEQLQKLLMRDLYKKIYSSLVGKGTEISTNDNKTL